MNFSNIKNILKNNRFKAFLLVLVTLISAMLIISSINMLSFTSMGGSSKTSDNGGGRSNKNSPGNNENRENRNNQENNNSQEGNGNWEDSEIPQKDGQADKDHDGELGETGGNNKDWDNSFENNEDGQSSDSGSFEDGWDGEGQYEEPGDKSDSEYFGDGGYDGYQNGDYTIPDELRKRLKNQRPQFNIDLSRDDSLPLDRYFGDGESYTVSDMTKPKHVPIFEILGRLDSPFIKLTVQDNYSNSKWYSNPEKIQSIII